MQSNINDANSSNIAYEYWSFTSSDDEDIDEVMIVKSSKNEPINNDQIKDENDQIDINANFMEVETEAPLIQKINDQALICADFNEFKCGSSLVTSSSYVASLNINTEKQSSIITPGPSAEVVSDEVTNVEEKDRDGEWSDI